MNFERNGRTVGNIDDVVIVAAFYNAQKNEPLSADLDKLRSEFHRGSQIVPVETSVRHGLPRFRGSQSSNRSALSNTTATARMMYGTWPFDASRTLAGT
jgi:hypothetical protein